MAVGSAFDAFVKSYLHYKIYGHYGPNNEYERDSIFEQQVEPQVRDFARKAGEHVFRRYSRSGALADLMLELDTAINEPRFEFDLKGRVDAKINSVPMLGKPDIYFTNSEGARVILDWKVNGYCSKSDTSPKKGYVKVRDTWHSLERKQSRYNGVPHKEAVVGHHCGLKINLTQYMEDCCPEWADQLAIYSWLLGEPIGSEELIIGIDQIVALNKDRPKNVDPWLRVANHRTRVSSEYQYNLRDRIDRLWTAITSGHFFTQLTLEQSQKRCQELEDMAIALGGDDPLSEFVNEVSRW